METSFEIGVDDLIPLLAGHLLELGLRA
jgi:hypothetical protein